MSAARPLVRRLAFFAALTTLAACAAEPLAPAANDQAGSVAALTPSFLLSPEESQRTIADSTDAPGNHVMVVEYAAGTYTLADGTGGSVASVTIKTVIPFSPLGTSSSGACITSTVQAVDATPGWTASVKKPGGCDREIVVSLENRATGQRAQFSFLYIFGKTRIDFGAVR